MIALIKSLTNSQLSEICLFVTVMKHCSHIAELGVPDDFAALEVSCIVQFDKFCFEMVAL